MGSRWSPRKRFAEWFARQLTKPLQSYELRVQNNLENLRKTLRKGDVVLVEGDQRISHVIRYLTQSSWSHSAIFVGDELLKANHGYAEKLAARFGSEAGHLLVEAVLRNTVFRKVP